MKSMFTIPPWQRSSWPRIARAIACVMLVAAYFTALFGAAPAAAASSPQYDPGGIGISFLLGGLVVNAESVAAMTQGFNTLFNEAFAAVQPEWNRVAMRVPSSGASELYGWMKPLSGLREWIGDRVVDSIAADGQTVVNKKYEKTVGVGRDDIEDDRLGVYRPLISEMGRLSAEHPDTLVLPLLNSGFSTECYDGQYFFDTDHPVLDANGDSQSVSNHGGGSGTPWFLLDITRAVKPLVWQVRAPYEFQSFNNPSDEHVFKTDQFLYGIRARAAAAYGLWQLAYGSKQTLNADNFNAAMAAMGGMLGDYDRPLALRPTLLVVPWSLRAAAKEVIEAERLASGATNTNYKAVDIHVSSYL